MQVRDERCLVVGGGGVAIRKVDGLLDQGARVTVVATEPVPGLVELAEQGKIVLERRAYRAGEAAGYALVFAATDEREVNRSVFEDARAANIWVNVADDPELCSFHLPARVQRGSLQLAIASAGEAPFVVRRLRQMFERRFGTEWAEWIEAAGRFRRGVLASQQLSKAERNERFEAFFAATVDQKRLTARVPAPDEERALLAGGPVSESQPPGQLTRVEARPPASSPHGERPGLVSLVGAGPGDPGLLTLRGHRRLLAADVVVYDRLAAPALPCCLKPEVELRGVGKQAGNHPVPQEEINALLVRLARQGKRVVRLKGGDPYVFGRGGEEAEALAEAGVPFEVVPAVTAGIAVPTYAGIPVTHRKEAVRVTIVTAHEARKTSGPQVRWDQLACDPHSTLLGYMGVTALPRVVESLLEAGMDPDTPAALIQRGTTSGQRVVRDTVANLPNAAKAANIKPPGLFVIGPTVRHADRLDWFSSRPLAGQRLLIPAPAGPMGVELDLAGAEVVEVSLPIRPAARVAIGALWLTGCVIRTVDELEAIDEERDGPGWGSEVVAWCFRPEVARRAEDLGWRRVRLLDPDGVEEDVAGAIQRGLATLPLSVTP